MTDLFMGTHPAVNFEGLDKELRAALPGKLDGIKNNAKNGDLWVVVTEGQNAESLRPQIAAVIAAHNPAVLTAEQQVTAAKEAAAAAVASANIAALVQSAVKATTLEELRPILLQAFDLLGNMALVQGLVTPTAVDAIEAVRPAPVDVTTEAKG